MSYEEPSELGVCGQASPCSSCRNKGPDGAGDFIPARGGRFIKKVTYEYVGSGKGEFEMIEEEEMAPQVQAPLWRVVCKTCCAFGIAAFLLLLVVTCIINSGSTTTTTAFDLRCNPGNGKPVPADCAEGSD